MSSFSSYCGSITPAHTFQADRLTSIPEEQVPALIVEAYKSLTSSSLSSAPGASELPLICHYIKGPYEAIVKEEKPLTYSEEDFDKIKKTVVGDLKVSSGVWERGQVRSCVGAPS